MSYGNRGIGHGMHGNSRPSLLGAGPNTNRRGASLSPQRNPVRRDHAKPGLLGKAPQRYQDDKEMYDRKDSYNDRRESSYQNTYQKQSYEGDPPGGDRYPPLPPPMPNKDRIPPKTRRIMENYGLTNSDLEELSRLPEHKLSSNNFIEMIKAMKNKKASPSQQQSFDDRYEPAPQSKKYDSYNSPPRYHEERRQEDAFSSFQEKWYSDTGKKNEREQQLPSSGSILRGSRGPMATPTRWEREERPAEQHMRRSPPRMMESQPRRMSPSPQRRASPVMMSSRRMSPPPIRRMSPPRRASPPPRRASPPPPRRHASPPVRMPKGLAGRGGLLGDPRDPSTQQLDMLASSANRPHDGYRPREFPEPGRREEPPMRSRTPPPLMAQVIPLARNEPPIPRPAPRPNMPRKQAPPSHPPPSEQIKPNSDMSFPKSHSMAEANAMRREVGRVLYLRYKAGAMGIIREEHLVKLAQPFEKVTNILLMAPGNLKSGWYQAFIELAHFDGAAAMLEHYMTRPPTIEGITLMVQRSKYPTLQLRKNQMNRDFDHLLDTKPEAKRRRATSSSPERGKKRPLRSRRDSSKDDESPKKKAFVKTQDKKEEKKPKVKKERRDSLDSKNSERSDKDSSAEKKSDKSERTKDSKKEKDASQDKDSKKEGTFTNGAATVVSKLQDEKNKERLDIIQDNLTQAISMSEELLPLITEESTKEILSEIMEYLTDSTNQLKEIEDTLK